MNKKLSILILCAVNIALITIGIFGSAYFENRAWLNFAVTSVGIVNFFGFLLTPLHDNEPSEKVLRRAIAGSITLVYLSVVTIFLFYRMSGPLTPIAEMLLTSFTTVVGIVLAFYFGSSAYSESKKESSDSK